MTLRTLKDAVELAHPKKRWKVLVFPDAGDLYWGCLLTQVPPADIASIVRMQEMCHESGFSERDVFGSRPRWLTVDKEAYAIGSTFRRLACLPWNGVFICYDRQNLEYIFCPEAPVRSLSKATARGLLRWRNFLGHVPYQIVHIPGRNNCRGDLLPPVAAGWHRCG